MITSDSKTILIVEDDFILAKMGQKNLEQLGYKSIIANTGEEAIAIFKNHNAVDLILMDIDLGSGIDGTEAAASILKDHDVPVVFLSSHTEPEIVAKTEKITSYGYIVKGTGITVLDASIKMAFKLFNSIRKELEKEKALQESEKNYRNIYDNALEGIYRTTIHGKNIQCNHSLASILGYDSPEEVIKNITDSGHQVWLNPEDRLRYVALLEKQDVIRGFESQYKRKNGSVIWVSINSRAVRDNSGKIIYFDGFIEDITERKRNEELHKQNEARLRRIVNILQHSCDTIQEFLDYALEQAIQLTESKVGYIYHYHEDRKEFVLNTWSKEVMAECGIANPLTCYELDKTGIWGEAVRQRKPIIINDFQADNILKKGYPKGHVELSKFMTIPIFIENKIVGVIGLANKTNDFNETDILQTSLLMEAVWKIITKMKAEEALKESEKRYRGLTENLDAGVVVHAPDTSIILNNARASELLGLSKEQMTGKQAIDPHWKFIAEDNTPLPLKDYPVRQIIDGKKQIKILY